jgi:glycosyltransferase involved in cell wall biosynthesis
MSELRVASIEPRPLRVVFWTPIPSPYMVDRFNALADAGELDLEVWFNAREVGGRSWEIDERGWRFAYRYLRARYWRGWWWGVPWPLLRNPKPDLVLILHSEPIYLLGWLIAKLRWIPTCVVLEGPSDGWSPRTRFKEAIKHFIFPRVEYTLSAGPQTQRQALHYGARPGGCFQLPHCVDVDHYFGGADRAMPARDQLRAELGLKGFTFICVGGLWPRKGVSYLLDAFAEVQRVSSRECSLLLVGDGELRSALEAEVVRSGLRNVVFAGFWQKPELPRLYACADVLVFPTLGDTNGYIVEEAMCAGLPAIATTAAGEIRERVAEGVTGFIVEPRDSSGLAERMLLFLADPARARVMGSAARRAVQAKNPANWAAKFAEIARRMTMRA